MVMMREAPSERQRWTKFVQEVKRDAGVYKTLKEVGIEEGDKGVISICIKHLENVPENFFDRKPELCKRTLLSDGSSKIERQTEGYIFSEEGVFLRMVNSKHIATQGNANHNTARRKECW